MMVFYRFYHTNRIKAMVHGSSIALPLWCLLLARCGDFSCFGLVVVLFLCLMGPVWHCEYLVGEVGAGYFVFSFCSMCPS